MARNVICIKEREYARSFVKSFYILWHNLFYYPIEGARPLTALIDVGRDDFKLAHDPSKRVSRIFFVYVKSGRSEERDVTARNEHKRGERIMARFPLGGLG